MARASLSHSIRANDFPSADDGRHWSHRGHEGGRRLLTWLAKYRWGLVIPGIQGETLEDEQNKGPLLSKEKVLFVRRP